MDSPEIARLFNANEKKCDVLLCMIDENSGKLYAIFIEEKSSDIRDAGEQIESSIKKIKHLLAHITWDNGHPCKEISCYRWLIVKYVHHHANKIDIKAQQHAYRKKGFIYRGCDRGYYIGDIIEVFRE